MKAQIIAVLVIVSSILIFIFMLIGLDAHFSSTPAENTHNTETVQMIQNKAEEHGWCPIVSDIFTEPNSGVQYAIVALNKFDGQDHSLRQCFLPPTAGTEITQPGWWRHSSETGRREVFVISEEVQLSTGFPVTEITFYAKRDALYEN